MLDFEFSHTKIIERRPLCKTQNSISKSISAARSASISVRRRSVGLQTRMPGCPTDSSPALPADAGWTSIVKSWNGRSNARSISPRRHCKEGGNDACSRRNKYARRTFAIASSNPAARNSHDDSWPGGIAKHDVLMIAVALFMRPRAYQFRAGRPNIQPSQGAILRM